MALLSPLVLLCLTLLAMHAEAITACSGWANEWGSLEIDLRLQSKIVPSKPTTDQPFSISQSTCRKHGTNHAWARKPVPTPPKNPTPQQKKKPWDPQYAGTAGMKEGPTTVSRPANKDVTIAGWTCDHILELNFLKRTMEATGGACDKALEEVKSEISYSVVMGKLRDVRHLMNNFQNLALHEGTSDIPGSPEQFKTTTVQNWVRSGSLRGQANNVWLFGGLNDYINKREKNVHTTIGKVVDDKIAATWPGAVIGVEAGWVQFKADVLAAYNEAVTAHKNQLQEEFKRANACENTDSNGGSGSGSNPIAATRRIARRHPSSLDNPSGHRTLWSPSRHVVSSLTVRARARSTPRAGARAPKAPSCPCKQQPAKKQVPRSKAKQRPAPSKKPRQPAKRPAPRIPTRPKQVAKRPANRPRRVPGKKSQPRRSTPKRKPKPVPKPTQRPKGKPRTRRRK